jgi:hypothetical protein
VYNRWGELVFETNDIEQAWDGNFQNNLQEIGAYTWRLNYYSVENKQEELAKGVLQLIR